MKTICRDRRQRSRIAAPENRVVTSVLSDVDRLLGPKSYDELETLEKQIKSKLDSNEPIDVDYWEQLLRSLTVWKARAKLKSVYQSVIDSRLRGLRNEEDEEAQLIREKLALILDVPKPVSKGRTEDAPARVQTKKDLQPSDMKWSSGLDPEPLLKLRTEDKGVGSIDEKAFLDKVVCTRRVRICCVLKRFVRLLSGGKLLRWAMYLCGNELQTRHYLPQDSRVSSLLHLLPRASQPYLTKTFRKPPQPFTSVRSLVA